MALDRGAIASQLSDRTLHEGETIMSRITQFSIALAFAASAAVTGTAQVVDGPYDRDWKQSPVAFKTLRLNVSTPQNQDIRSGKGTLTIYRNDGTAEIGPSKEFDYTEQDGSAQKLGKRKFEGIIKNNAGTKAYKVVAYFIDRPETSTGTQEDDRMVIHITCVEGGTRFGGDCEIHYETRRCCRQGRDRCGRPCRIEYDICVPVRKLRADNACDPDDELLME